MPKSKRAKRQSASAPQKNDQEQSPVVKINSNEQVKRVTATGKPETIRLNTHDARLLTAYMVVGFVDYPDKSKTWSDNKHSILDEVIHPERYYGIMMKPQIFDKMGEMLGLNPSRALNYKHYYKDEVTDQMVRNARKKKTGGYLPALLDAAMKAHWLKGDKDFSNRPTGASLVGAAYAKGPQDYLQKIWLGKLQIDDAQPNQLPECSPLFEEQLMTGLDQFIGNLNRVLWYQKKYKLRNRENPHVDRYLEIPVHPLAPTPKPTAKTNDEETPVIPMIPRPIVQPQKLQNNS